LRYAAQYLISFGKKLPADIRYLGDSRTAAELTAAILKLARFSVDREGGELRLLANMIQVKEQFGLNLN
jgi:hypothetical protein